MNEDLDNEHYDVPDEHDSLDGMESIAIIAMAGRFPGAADVDQFWANIRDGVESVKFFTDEELSDSNIEASLLKNPRFVKADAILDDIDMFDAEFFNYSPREAEIMDPQHRLFMEACWQAMEMSGYNPENYLGRVGVFGGSGLSSYLIRNLLKNSDYVDSVGSFQTMLANSQDFLCTKVSYKMNLMGPSVNVNTLCSSSMVAVHLACQSLWNYQTDLNLAGGVSIQASRNEAFFYQEGGIGAFDGHCRAFDARAGGTVSGSGLGLVVLKRLSEAQADRDTVHALIRGSAINNDGSVKLSYTAPSIDGQAEVIGEAQTVAGIDPESISYVECHGTGTALGDPIEIAGLTKAFRAHTDKTGFCAVGSVKTNIGHLVTGGGVASMIKTVMALKARQIPPSLNFENPNPKIDFEASPFFVNTKLRPWLTEEGVPRRAGVSSFGIGGTNAHLILEEAPLPLAGVPGRAHHLLPISARSESAAAAAVANLASWLKQNPDQDLADVAFTLQIGRKAFNNRRLLLASTREQAIEDLSNPQTGKLLSQFQERNERSVVFLFSGQGSQYVGMARGIYDSEPIFQQVVDRCAVLLQQHLDLDLRELIWPQQLDASLHNEQSSALNDTAITQPALFVIEYALAQLFQAWGIIPKAMIGHSIGEYVAATLAGVFSLEDALALVAARGRLIAELPSGDMLAVSLNERKLTQMLGPDLSLAVVNGAEACVVSGATEPVAALAERLKQLGISCSLLHTSHAFHSHMMDPIIDSFTQRLSQLSLSAPKIAYISNLTGTWITPEQATDPGYWARHLRQTVRFHEGLTNVMTDGEDVLLEIGPGRTLTTLARRHQQKSATQVVFHAIRNHRESVTDDIHLHTAVGKLWLAGVALDWNQYHGDSQRRRVPLPTYPFERRRYWIEPDLHSFSSQSKALEQRVGVRKQDLGDWFYLPCFKRTATPPVPRELPPNVNWLLFFEGDGLGYALGNRLLDEGHKVVTVQSGPAFNKLDHGIFQLRPDQLDDYLALLEDLASESLMPHHIVYFRASSTGSVGEYAAGFYNVLYTIQALDRNNSNDSAMLTVVTDRFTEVSGEELCLDGATSLGLLQVIPQEFPHISTAVVDVNYPEIGSWQQDQLVGQLLAELTGVTRPQLVAYKGNQRWQHCYEPVSIEASDDIVRQGGTFLILGGLDGTGLVLAEFLAKTARANLVLTCAGAFPDQQTWADVAKQLPQVARLRALEEAGTRILAVPHTAIEKPASLNTLFTKVEQHFGKLHGLIHAEGPFGREAVVKPIAELSSSNCEPHFSAKVRGLYALEEALTDRDLDFCIMISSLAAVLGGLGLAPYAAACCFMDHFVVRHNRTHKTPWLSLNWDGWLSSGNAALGEAHAELVINWQDGVAALGRVISGGGFDQVAVSVEDLPARIAYTRAGRVEEKQFTVHPRPNLTNPYVAPSNDTERKIAAIWQDRLGIEQVGIHDNYFDLGGDSLLIVKIRRALQKEFGGELLTSELFEHPTVGALALHFSQEKGKASIERVQDRARKQQAAMESEEFVSRKRARRKQHF